MDCGNMVSESRIYAPMRDWESTAKAKLILTIQSEVEALFLLSTPYIEKNLHQRVGGRVVELGGGCISTGLPSNQSRLDQLTIWIGD